MAVNGITDSGGPGQYDFSHTLDADDKDKWWQVDLAVDYIIEQVTLINRKEGMISLREFAVTGAQTQTLTHVITTLYH